MPHMLSLEKSSLERRRHDGDSARLSAESGLQAQCQPAVQTQDPPPPVDEVGAPSLSVLTPEEAAGESEKRGWASGSGQAVLGEGERRAAAPSAFHSPARAWNGKSEHNRKLS